jgi:hypothetical protein
MYTEEELLKGSNDDAEVEHEDYELCRIVCHPSKKNRMLCQECDHYVR